MKHQAKNLTRKLASALVGTALFGLAACSGGGGGGAPGGGAGGGGGGGDNGLNKGSYKKESFDYKDPYPAKFQPLGQKNFEAVRREEIAVLSGNAAGTPYATVLDDIDQKHAQNSRFTSKLLEPGFEALTSATGQIDHLAGDDLAVVGRFGKDLRLALMTSLKDGTWVRSAVLAITSPTTASYVKLRTMDVDNDGREELLLSVVYNGGGGFFRIYDDPTQAFQILHNQDIGGCIRLDAQPCDVDGDNKPEIALFCRESRRAHVTIHGVLETRFAVKRKLAAVDRYALSLVVGNFDLDGPDEIAVVTQVGAGAHILTYDMPNAGGFKVIESAKIETIAYRMLDAVRVDSNRDKIDELGFVYTVRSGRRYYTRVGHWATKYDRATRSNRLSRWGFIYSPYAAIATFDGNADGNEELVSTQVGNANRRAYTYSFRSAESKGKIYMQARSIKNDPVSGSSRTAVLAAGDFDRENLTLRSTGKKWTHLPDPMPLVVMAAPPTKSGIKQNYDNSSTSYGTEKSVERSHGVTTGWTASFSVGFEAEDIFGAFGASAKQTISTSMQKTLTQTKRETWTKTFDGAYDNDVIIFQGTLYQCYEYEIVSAENKKLVGSKITLNDPVATKTYKWTVDHFNKTVAANRRIGKDVLQHAIGAPQSYIKKVDAETKLGKRTGWIDTGLEVGAVPGGTNSTSVNISDANSKETTRSFAIDWEAEVKIGGATIGGSFGLNRDSIYSVTVEKGTTYAGTVGDIETQDDWDNWRYSFGLFVYRTHMDKAGKASKGKLPFHVVTYWVDDLGPSYTQR